jgi:hypothetical protein
VPSSPADGPPLYGLDVETDTSVDGLDPSCSAIVAVAVATPWGDEVLTGAEPDLLRRTDDLVASLPAGVLVTWNGSGFDLPFLADRSRLAGVPIGLRLWNDASVAASRPSLPGHAAPYRGAWYHHGHLDGYRLYRSDVGRSLGLSCGLKALARLCGLEPVEVDRSQVHRLGHDELRDYVASDARLARALVARRLPAALGFADRGPVPAVGVP